MKKADVTDRAKRYRANRAIPPSRDKRCVYCGNPDASDVEHVNGIEDDAQPENLTHSCRSCNVKKGVTFARAGIGVLTRQFNPASGATSLGQYMSAVLTLRGESDAMSLPAAIKLMHNTPADVRSGFAAEIWRRRRARGNDGTKVPF